jgi:hypothetical protein
MEPATRRQATGKATPVTAPTTGEQTAECSRQLCVTEGGPGFLAVISGQAIPRLTSGPINAVAKGTDSSEPAASMEAALGRKSPDLSGLMSGMPAGATPPSRPRGPRRRTPEQNIYFRLRGQRHARLPEVAAEILPQRSDGPSQAPSSGTSTAVLRRRTKDRLEGAVSTRDTQQELNRLRRGRRKERQVSLQTVVSLCTIHYVPRTRQFESLSG